MDQDRILASTPVSKPQDENEKTSTAKFYISKETTLSSDCSFDDTNPKSQDEINPSYITPVNPAVTETTYEDDTHVPTTCCPLTYCCIVPSADSVKSASSSASSLSPNYATCIRCRSKSHPNLTILVVFLAVMIDVMLMTVIDPILPDLMIRIDLQPSMLVGDRFLSKPLPLDNYTLDGNLTRKHSMEIALLVGLKPGLEMVFNVAVGFIVDRIGHQIPMITGCGFNLAATLSFAYLRNYYLLVLARGLQALGSSLSVVGGLALLAASFSDDKTRSLAISKAFAGVSFGVAGGFALGSILYQFCGKESPFLIIAGLNVADGVMRMLILSPTARQTAGVGLSYAKSLLADKQILIGLAITFMQNLCLGVFLGTGPAWMLYTLHSQQWMVGTILAIAAVIHVTSQFLTGKFSLLIGQWRFILMGQLIIAFGTASYPFCTTPWEVIIPECITRIGQGMLMACVNPMLCHIVDLRHDSHYGLISGLYTATYNLALFTGPNLGGGLIKLISFDWIYWGLGLVMVVFSFTALGLRHIGVRDSADDSQIEESNKEEDSETTPLLKDN